MNLRDTYTSTIQKGDVAEPLLFHDKHFYVEALVLPQDHKLNYLWLHYLQSKLFRTTTTVYYTTGDREVHEQAGEAHCLEVASHHNYLQKKKDYYTS